MRTKTIIYHAKKFFLKEFAGFTQYSNPRKKETLYYCISYLIPFLRPRCFKPTLNFLVTSKAEVRVFSPIIKGLIEDSDTNAIIVVLGDFRFSSALEKSIQEAKNIEKTAALYPIVHSCLNPKKWLNVVCLDHKLHYRFHGLGVGLVDAINATGGKSVCLQHGSTRKDNIEGHKTSRSKFQIVWGSYIYQKLIGEMRLNESNIFLEGNPLHDELFLLDPKLIRSKLKRYLHDIGKSSHKKKLILLATCLHSEYDNRNKPQDLYKQYIRQIYENIDFENYFLIVKMHPMDSMDTNLYEEQLNPEYQNSVVILHPDDSTFSFYELAKIATLTITRASTVAEESLMIGKSVLAYDLFTDGPSKDLKYLRNIPRFEICAGREVRLSPLIKRMCESRESEHTDNQKLIFDITYKLDGNSTKRVVKRLKVISGSQCNDKEQR